MLRAELLLAVVLAAGCGGGTPQTVGVAPARVVVAEATAPEASRTRTLSAIVEGEGDATLASRVGGVVVERLAEVGDPVETGQALLRLEDREVRASVRAAQAAVAQAEVARDEAASRRRRVQAIGDAASAADREAAELGERAAEAALQGAQARLASVKVALDHHTLRVPGHGVVVRLAPRVGELVAAGAPIARIADVGRLRIRIGLSDLERRALLEPGASIGVHADGRVAEGRVVRSAAAADPATASWPVELEVDAATGLSPGTTVEVRLALPVVGASAAVPSEAVRDGEVWLVREGRLVRADVRVISDVGRSSLVDGLAPGERVVIRGLRGLREGEPVLAVQETP